MFEIRTLDDIRGNNVAIYSIKTLLERKTFPNLSIMSGVLGVGKTSVAKVIANTLDSTGAPAKIYNCGMPLDMTKIQEEVFSLNPMHPRAFIFEEVHGLSKADQNALLQMFDTQSRNVYIICTTTEIHKLLRTIRSRAQVWEFKLLSDKQCAQLLDDYLASQGAKLSDQSKRSLLRASRGIPRDLIKNADFAIKGEFDNIQLDALLGNVSDEAVYSVFCSLLSDTSDFVSNIDGLLEEASASKLSAMYDFWLRYLIERVLPQPRTLSKGMIEQLDQLYSDKDRVTVSKTILRSKSDTILLELITLNMSLTGATRSAVLGQQRDTASTAERESLLDKQRGQTASGSALITRGTVSKMKL